MQPTNRAWIFPGHRSPQVFFCQEPANMDCYLLLVQACSESNPGPLMHAACKVFTYVILHPTGIVLVSMFVGQGKTPQKSGQRENIDGEPEESLFLSPKIFQACLAGSTGSSYQLANDLCRRPSADGDPACPGGRVLSLRKHTSLFWRSSSGQDLGIRLSWCTGVQQRSRISQVQLLFFFFFECSEIRTDKNRGYTGTLLKPDLAVVNQSI